MMEAVSGPLLRLLRVPPRPHLPAGDPRSARVFRAAHNYWRLRLLVWSARQALALAGFVVLFVIVHVTAGQIEIPRRGGRPPLTLSAPLSLWQAMEAAAVGLWLVQLPFTLAVLRLDYELRWYIVTDRAARLREGILGLREMTFTLANVQDIRLKQGPLQRLLGLSDVELRTAGGSDLPSGAEGAGHGENLHLARFRGVDNAEEIRDLVADRMKRARGAGLGDPDDGSPSAEAPPAGLAAAARELGEESARLRAAAARALGGGGRTAG